MSSRAEKMKVVKTFVLPDFLKDLGDEWKGTYQICQINARELLAAVEEAQTNRVPVPYAVTIKSVLHNNKPLGMNSEIPCKLYEILSNLSLPYNLVDKREFDGYLQESTDKDFTDSDTIVTIEQIQPLFDRLKTELTAEFSEIKEVSLFGGLKNRGKTDHDIDIFIELDPSIDRSSTKRFAQITEKIFQLSLPFPLTVEIWLKIGSQTLLMH
jgi:predicted nucleotidyltransferase